MAPKYINRLAGQHILILGGTSGIGYAVAEAAIEFGATITISSSNPNKIESKIKLLSETYPDAQSRIFGHVCDLSNPETIETNIIQLLESTSQPHKINHIVHTAGDALSNPPLPKITVDSIYKAQTVRGIAGFILGKHAKTYMVDSPSSSIVLTGGVASYKPAPGWTLMAALGGVTDSLVRTLAVNLAPIRVNGVSPGAVPTELWGGGQKLPEAQAQAIAAQLGSQVLTGRVGTVEDVAEAYIYFLRDTFVTGQMLLTDGGSLLKS